MAIIIKTPKQIQGIRESSKLAAKTLKYLGGLVSPGITTAYLDNKAEIFIRDHNAIPAPLNYNGFPKSICTSVNNVICHGIPDNTVLKSGDIIKIDVTTILNGYYGDTCKSFPVGDISKESKQLIKVTKKCLDIGINQVYPGNRFGNIGYVIKKYAKRFGYGVVYEYTGHGVGVNFHEDPSVFHSSNKNTGDIMLPGMIFTIEPMINIGTAQTILDKNDGWTVYTKDGSLSAQEEHTILVTEASHAVLTVCDYGCL